MRLALSTLTASALAWVTLAQPEASHGRYPRHHKPQAHPEQEAAASSAKAFKPIEGGRRLDAFDDRMAGYEQQGKYWEQWAIDHGYAPGPNSKYGKPPQEQQPQAPPQQQAPPPQQQQHSDGPQWVSTTPSTGSTNKQSMGGAAGNEFGDYFNLALYQEKAKHLEAWASQEGRLPTFWDGPAQQQQSRLSADDYDDMVDMPRRLPSNNDDENGPVDIPLRRLPSDDDNEGPKDVSLRRLPNSNNDNEPKVDMPRRLPSDSADDGPKDIPLRRQLAEESAFDERVSYYKALSEWQQNYWQEYAKEWVSWSQEQGLAPSSPSAGDVPRKLQEGEEAPPKDAFDERMEEHKASADYYKAFGEWEKNYWVAYGNGWAKWTVDKGYAPSPESKIYQQQHVAAGVQEVAKDTVDSVTGTATETVNRYDAVASQETAYWQEQAQYRKEKGAARGQAWVEWAQRQGYMPSPKEEPEVVAAVGGEGGKEGATSRRLDAFDDRMARYEAIGKFEEQYWKQRGKSWEEWTVEQGYAPGPDSKYGKPAQAAVDPAQAEAEWRAERAQWDQQQQQQEPMVALSAADKAEAIRGGFYEAEGRSWAEWFRTQTFGEDGEAFKMPEEAYVGTPGFEGKKGPVQSIAEKLRMDVGASGEILAAVPEDSVSDKAQEDVYKHQSWVGRSAARVVNGVENGAGHVYSAGERIVERAEDAAKSAVGIDTPAAPVAATAGDKEAVTMTETLPAPHQKHPHKHMRGQQKAK